MLQSMIIRAPIFISNMKTDKPQHALHTEVVDTVPPNLKFSFHLQQYVWDVSRISFIFDAKRVSDEVDSQSTDVLVFEVPGTGVAPTCTLREYILGFMFLLCCHSVGE